MGEEKEYTAKVLVTRTYEISFSSPDLKQAKDDAETICETEEFEMDYTGQTTEVLNIVEEENVLMRINFLNNFFYNILEVNR